MFAHESPRYRPVRNSHFAGEAASGRGVLEYKPTGSPLGSSTRAMAPAPSGRLKGNPGAIFQMFGDAFTDHLPSEKPNSFGTSGLGTRSEN